MLLKDVSRSHLVLVRDETHARGEQMAQQPWIETGDGQGAFEGPHRPLGVGRVSAGAHGGEELVGVDSVPVHATQVSRANRTAFGSGHDGYGPFDPRIEQEGHMHDDIWTYRDRSSLGSNVAETKADLTGFDVEALDGSIGSIDEATYDVGKSYVVVDTGPWIFGKKVMLPAGVVRGVDEENQIVFVNRTKDEIKNAPELDLDALDESNRSSVGSYYGPGGPAYRSWDDAY